MSSHPNFRLVRAVATGIAATQLAALTGRTQDCTGHNHIEWPAQRPVWKLCWLSPVDSSGPDASGIEIRHAFYKDKRVFWRANMPVLNVLYDTGCGPTYRDWMNQLSPFEANNVIQPGYAEPTSTPVTVCDHPGTDAGTFSGVAVEKLKDRLILTSQMSAGWYRYIQKWVFHLDGTIEPQFGFTAVNHNCTSEAHDHHGYFRFDLDIDGAANDRIRQRKRFLFWHYWSTIRVESKRLRNAGNSRRWCVQDKGSKRGVEILPGSEDHVGGDAFGGSDVWALRYHGTETDDGGATGGSMGDAQHIDPFINGEGVNGSDVVLWYRVGHRHEHGLGCTMVGPKLKLVGNW